MSRVHPSIGARVSPAGLRRPRRTAAAVLVPLLAVVGASAFLGEIDWRGLVVAGVVLVTVLLLTWAHWTHQSTVERLARSELLRRQQAVLGELWRLRMEDQSAFHRHVMEVASRMLEVARVNIWHFSADFTELRCLNNYVASERRHEVLEQPLPMAQRPCYRVALRDGRCINADDAVADPRTAEFADDYLRPLGITSMLDVPIRENGDLYGAICFEHIGPRRHWTEEEQIFATGLADLLAHVIVVEKHRAIENALRESEACQRILIEACPDTVQFKDAEGRWQVANSAVLRLFGLKQAEWRGKTDLELARLHPELAHVLEGCARSDAAVLREGHAQRLEEPVPQADGLHHFDVHKVPLLDGHGQPAGLLVLRHDITAQKQAHEQVERMQQQRDALLNTIQGIVWEADATTLQFTYVSREAERLLGYPLRQWTEELHFWERHIHPDDRTRTLADCIGHLRQGRDSRMEYRMLSFDGRVVWLRDHITLVWESGRVKLLRGVMLDVTERKQSEEALRESESRFQELAAHVDSVFWMSSADGRQMLYVSPAYERMWGRPCAGVITNPLEWPEAIHSDDRERVQQAFLAAQDGASYNEEYRVIRPDGSVCWVRDKAFLVRDAAGHAIHLAGIAEDITEKRAAHEALQQFAWTLEARVRERTAELERAEAEHASIVTSISHNLRTPLRALHGYSEVLQKLSNTGLTHEAREYLESISHNALQMGRLLDDLLAFLALYSSPVVREWVLPGALAHEAFAVLKSHHPGRALEFTVGDLPPCTADPQSLAEVFNKLLSNAIKFTPPEALGHIEVGGRREEQKGAWRTVYWVRDNGIGFDMRFVHKIFALFQRLNWEEEGTGCGLALVQRIIERHGGEVWAESEPGHGAIFYFALPEVRPEEIGFKKPATLLPETEPELVELKKTA